MNIPGMLKAMTNSFGSSTMRDVLDDVLTQRDAYESAKERAGSFFNLSAYKAEKLGRPRHETEEGGVYAKHAPADKSMREDQAATARDTAWARTEDVDNPGKEPDLPFQTKGSTQGRDFPYHSAALPEKIVAASQHAGRDAEESPAAVSVHRKESESVDLSV